MVLTPTQKKHAVTLIESGKKQDAVRFFRQTLNITDEQALVLTEKLKKEVAAIPPATKFMAFNDDPQINAGTQKSRGGQTLFLALGIFIMAAAVYLVVSNYQFEQRSVIVQGKVIGYESYTDREDNGSTTTMHTPVFQYEYKGETYNYKSKSSSAGQDYIIDEPIDIFVNPDDPADIIIDTLWGKWLLPILLGFMGAVFTMMGFLRFRVS